MTFRKAPTKVHKTVKGPHSDIGSGPRSIDRRHVTTTVHVRGPEPPAKRVDPTVDIQHGERKFQVERRIAPAADLVRDEGGPKRAVRRVVRPAGTSQAVPAGSAVLSIRIEPALKADTMVILDQIGLSFSDAVRLLCKRILMDRGLPFALRIPSGETGAGLREDEQEEDGPTFSSADELFASLDAEIEADRKRDGRAAKKRNTAKQAVRP